MNAALTLISLATGGTAALMGAAFLMGFNNNKLIADEAAAKHFVYLYAPDCAPQNVALSVDRRSALVLGSGNDLFL